LGLGQWGVEKRVAKVVFSHYKGVLDERVYLSGKSEGQGVKGVIGDNRESWAKTVGRKKKEGGNCK